jgi:hypothetical protein
MKNFLAGTSAHFSALKFDLKRPIANMCCPQGLAMFADRIKKLMDKSLCASSVRQIFSSTPMPSTRTNAAGSTRGNR